MLGQYQGVPESDPDEKALKAAMKMNFSDFLKENPFYTGTRAGMLESFLVCPGELTDDQVMELLKISFRQPEVVLALAKMVHDVHERGNVQNPLE